MHVASQVTRPSVNVGSNSYVAALFELSVIPESVEASAVITPLSVVNPTSDVSLELSTSAGTPFEPPVQPVSVPVVCAQISTAVFAAAVALVTSVNFAFYV